MIKTKVFLVAIASLAVITGAAFGITHYQLQKPIATNGGPALVAAVAVPAEVVPVALIATSSPKQSDIATSSPKLAATNVSAATTISKPKTTPAPTPILAHATAVSNRSAITDRLADQKSLGNESVAIVCINPILPGRVGTVSFGSGVIVGKNGYILTNEHVIQDSAFCYMGRPRAVPEYFQARVAAPTIALYYSLKIIGTGVGVTDPSDDTKTSSFHDFAVLKIDAKMPPKSEWQSDQASPEVRTLSATWIPWATDAEYAQFSPDGSTFPAMNINFDYQPVRGDLLSMGGYIADAGIPDYTFASGNLSVFSTTTLSVSMPTGQGLSGSPVVDDKGNLVALNFEMDCGQWKGCYNWDNQNDPGFSSFTYGNQALSLTVPFIDQAMKQDLGFGLREVAAMK